MRSSHPCTSVSVCFFVDVFVKFLKWKWKLVHLLQTEFALFSVVVLAISKEVQIGKAAFWWDISCLFNLCVSFVRSDMSLFVKRVCMFYLPCSNVSWYLFRFWWISAIFICGYNYLFWYPLEIQHLCLSIERLRTKKNELEQRTFSLLSLVKHFSNYTFSPLPAPSSPHMYETEKTGVSSFLWLAFSPNTKIYYAFFISLWWHWSYTGICKLFLKIKIASRNMQK